MKLELFFEIIFGQEAAKGGSAHVADVEEAEMVFYRRDDALPSAPVETEPLEDLLTHLRSDPRMVRKKRGTGGVPGRRLADVV